MLLLGVRLAIHFVSYLRVCFEVAMPSSAKSSPMTVTLWECGRQSCILSFRTHESDVDAHARKVVAV